MVSDAIAETRESGPLRLGRREFGPEKTLVMAIVNRTPDSFYRPGVTWDELSRELTLTCDAQGRIVDLDGRAARLLGVKSGDAFTSLAVPGTEEKAETLLGRAANLKTDMPNRAVRDKRHRQISTPAHWQHSYRYFCRKLEGRAKAGID